MTHDSSLIASIHLLHQSGKMVIPADSGNGNVGRPRAAGPQGGRIASLETFFDFYINNVPLPSEARSINPNFEQVLRMHADVAAAHDKRTITVAAMPWRVEPNPDAPDKHYAEVIADHCRRCVKKIPNFSQMVEMLQYAVMVGGQGIEIVWDQDATGVETPRSWHPVHMTRFSFDRLGNMALLTRDTPVWGAYISGNPQGIYTRQLPRGRFIYHMHRQGQGQWDHPEFAGYEYYGIGLDVPLYYVVTFDVFCLKFRMKFLERYGMGTSVLYYPENRKNSNEILKIADSLRGESMISVPRLMGTSQDANNFNSLYKVEQLDMPAGTYDYFAGFSDQYTLPRVNAIMLGSSSEAKGGSSEDNGGGYSKAVTEKDSGPSIWFKRDAENIGSTLTDQFLPAIVLGRFPNTPKEYWPIFSIEPKEEKDRAQELDIIEKAMKMVPIGKAHIYDAADLPVPKPGEETVGGEQQQQPGMPGAPGQPGQPTPPGAKPPLTQQKPGAPMAGMPKNPVGHGANGGNGAIVNRTDIKSFMGR
jgi:hypothetical protein